MRARPRAAALAGTALALAVLTGCGSDPESSDAGDAADPVPTADAGDLPPGYSEECAAAFPIWFGDPDPDAADLRPDDWPEPVDDATLCRTSGTAGDAQQIADYATAESPVAVLDAFESALGGLDGYEIAREDPGVGHEVVQGVAGEVGFQVDPTEGGYTLTFIAPGA